MTVYQSMERSNHEQRQNKRNTELCKLVKQNDLMAENRLLMENEGLIIKIASSIEASFSQDDILYGGNEKDDIIQEGRIAMLRAAQLYDENSGAQFTTFAYTVVRNAMFDLCQKGMSAFEKRMIDAGLTRVFLNDDQLDEDGMPIIEKIRVGEQDPTGNAAVLHLLLEKMHNRLELLPQRQRIFLAYHYGLNILKCNTIGETAAYFHLTEKYANQIEKTALNSLRQAMNDGKIV